MKSATRSMHVAISWQTSVVLQQQSSKASLIVQVFHHFLTQWQSHVSVSGASQSSSQGSKNFAGLPQPSTITARSILKIPVIESLSGQNLTQRPDQYDFSS
ncbi:uncharacterized protein EAF01_004542 [Botrytis porri]|uniref:uncharacterized protein n=1 Tax=Botrytis porri TaxID=87229 RepID=UPI0018FF98B6|nr:uncharacterized protein EAF01_004542 [Botrytis porri]KAF7908787.1 hypothetical protein EAF01_004542 [Botrytis porri]